MQSQITPNTPAIATHPDAFEEALGNFLLARDRLNSMPDTIERAEEEQLIAAYSYTETVLMETEVSSVSELRTKFEIIFADDQSSPSRRQLLSFFADLQRLTNNSPSQVFQPEKWLLYFERVGGMHCCRDGEVFLLCKPGLDLGNAMFELEATGGREAVNALIRARA